jgi:hypothetical protein
VNGDGADLGPARRLWLELLAREQFLEQVTHGGGFGSLEDRRRRIDKRRPWRVFDRAIGSHSDAV